MEPQFDKTVMQTLGNEFGLQSELFQQFIYFILEDKLKNAAQLQVHDDEIHLIISNIPNEETGLIINDLAAIIKPSCILYKPPISKPIKDVYSTSTIPKPSDEHYKRFKNLDILQPVTQISRGCAVTCANDENVGLPPLQNTCPIRGNYIKLNDYPITEPIRYETLYYNNNNLYDRNNSCNKIPSSLTDRDVKKIIAPTNKLLNQAIEYNMQYIVKDFIKNNSNFINLAALGLIIRQHNLDLFNLCLPLVKEVKTSTTLLQVAVRENQYEMIHLLLKHGAIVTTGAICDICKLDDPKKVLTWINLYSDDSEVDYHSILSTVDVSIDIIKLLIHHVDPIYVINKAIFDDNLELFTTFIHLVQDKRVVIAKCIEHDRIEMIKHICSNDGDEGKMDDVTFNQIFTESVNYCQTDFIKYIVQFDNDIPLYTWKNVEPNLDYLCNESILPHIIQRCPSEFRYSLLFSAVCKNDDWCVDFILEHSQITLTNFNDVIFKQALFNKNANVLCKLCKILRANQLRINQYCSDGLQDLLELVQDPEMKEILISAQK